MQRDLKIIFKKDQWKNGDHLKLKNIRPFLLEFPTNMTKVSEALLQCHKSSLEFLWVVVFPRVPLLQPMIRLQDVQILLFCKFLFIWRILNTACLCRQWRILQQFTGRKHVTQSGAIWMPFRYFGDISMMFVQFVTF